MSAGRLLCWLTVGHRNDDLQYNVRPYGTALTISSQYVTRHLHQLSLAILVWIDAVSTSRMDCLVALIGVRLSAQRQLEFQVLKVKIEKVLERPLLLMVTEKLYSVQHVEIDHYKPLLQTSPKPKAGNCKCFVTLLCCQCFYVHVTHVLLIKKI